MPYRLFLWLDTLERAPSAVGLRPGMAIAPSPPYADRTAPREEHQMRFSVPPIHSSAICPPGQRRLGRANRALFTSRQPLRPFLSHLHGVLNWL